MQAHIHSRDGSKLVFILLSFILVMGEKPVWNDLIQYTLNELLKFRLTFGEVRCFEDAYAQVLIAYLQGDSEAFEGFLSKFSEIAKTAKLDSRDVKFLKLAATLRKQLCERHVDPILLSEALELSQKDVERSGEILFIAAMGYEALNDFVQMKEIYRLAYLSLEASGAKKKAVKALLNHVVADSRIHPKKKLIYDYQLVFHKAREAGVPGAAGIALLNISREYQKLDAFVAAIKYCNRALKFLKLEGETRPYFMAIVHRCHLLLQLGQVREAQFDYDLAKASSFPEVLGALEVIEGIQKHQTIKNPIRHPLTPTWRERFRQKEAWGQEEIKKLSPSEDRLVQLLTIKPLDKFELISELYGNLGNILAAENRLNNLFSRIRKKHPGLVIFWEGKYSIADETLLKDHN